MTVSDAALLAVLRDEHRPPAAAIAVILAWRVVTAEGRTPTIAEVQDLTGYGRAQVYRARAWIDEQFPGWRSEDPEPVETPAPAAIDAASVVVVEDRAVEPVEPVLHRPRILTRRARPAPPAPPVWRDAVERRVAALAPANGTAARSWDLYSDVYAPAADEVLDGREDGNVAGDLIALTIDYLEAACGEPIRGSDRARIAQLCRSYGKAALYGLSEAVPRTETLTVDDYVRYATRVCQNVVAKLRGTTP